jgi:hypothetical protein
VLVMVEFGDSSEPWSVARGGVKRWLHCQISDVTALPDEHQTELGDWLESRSIPTGSRLLILRDQAGNHTLHVAGAVVDVNVADLPLWMQRPQPQPKPDPAPKLPTPRAKAVR